MKKSILAVLILVGCLVMTGCGKENKYVNVGVEMSTAGMSLYLSNIAKELENISTYVFFAESAEAAIDKVCREKQGIDITYIPVEKLGLLKKGLGLKVVFPDCLKEDGSLKGVWVARTGWIESAPKYSYNYIRGLVKSADYRAANMEPTYSEGLVQIKGQEDFDFDEMDGAMLFCAVYTQTSGDKLEDTEFVCMNKDDLKEMFAFFDGGTGKGYELCADAYERFCSSDCEAFEEMFDFSLMNKAIDEIDNEEKQEK